MGLFDFLKPKNQANEIRSEFEPPKTSLAAGIEARRHYEAESNPEAAEFEAGLRREAIEREEILSHLGDALYRCLEVDVHPDGNPVLVEGLWFLEEKLVVRGEAFWQLHFCFPCQNCGELAKAIRLEVDNPYEDLPRGPELEAVREKCMQEIAGFLDRVEAGKKRFLCPDCKLEEKPA